MLSTSEGRAVPDLAAGGWNYEYFLKDHLGTTRVSVGTETETLTFTATMEAADATEEETYFKNLPETRHQDAVYNHTSGGSYAAWLNGAQGRIAGPAIALKVHPGDTVNMEVFAQYATGTGNNPGIVGNLTAAVAASFGWVSTAPETNYIIINFNKLKR